MSESKQYEIPKGAVIEAYKRVKANKGSAGIDGIDFEVFEKKLNNNLYKIWNRMSSGSYFPSPVLAVEIPKKTGGTRRRKAEKWLCTVRKREPRLFAHWSNLYSYC